MFTIAAILMICIALWVLINSPNYKRPRRVMLLTSSFLLAAVVMAVSTPFDGRILSRSGSGGGFQIGRNWGTFVKGHKIGTLTFAPSAASRAFVTSGTLPSSILVGLHQVGSCRTTSATLAQAAITTDSLTLTLPASASTTLTWHYCIETPGT